LEGGIQTAAIGRRLHLQPRCARPKSRLRSIGKRRLRPPFRFRQQRGA